VFLTDLFTVIVGKYFLSQLAEKLTVFFAKVAAGFADTKRLRLISLLQSCQRLLKHIGIGYCRAGAAQDVSSAVK
jgi:hypothetical protein